MKIKEVIAKRDSGVISVREEDTVETVAKLLKLKNIGCVTVQNARGELVGILSERDIARSFARDEGPIRELLVRNLMTGKVITCDVEEDLRSAMDIMARHHIRHLPVMSSGKLIAMISSRDLLQAVLAEVTIERNVLRDIAIAGR